jgi:hypothetical protein
MVKAYLRYIPSAQFGVIASNSGNAILDHQSKFALTPALDGVNVWDLKKGTLVEWCIYFDLGNAY